MSLEKSNARHFGTHALSTYQDALGALGLLVATTNHSLKSSK